MVKRPDTLKIKWMGILIFLREMIGRMDRELNGLLKSSKFKDYRIKPVVHQKHTHNVIIATK